MMEVIHYSRLAFAATSRAACRRELSDTRWASGFKCPACGNFKAYYIRTRDLYECADKSCKRQTSATAGTQFHGTRNIVKLWNGMRASIRRTARLSCSALMKVMDAGFKLARRAKKIISITAPDSYGWNLIQVPEQSETPPGESTMGSLEMHSQSENCFCLPLLKLISLARGFIPP